MTMGRWWLQIDMQLVSRGATATATATAPLDRFTYNGHPPDRSLRHDRLGGWGLCTVLINT